jgi:hypothetical protein
VLLKPKCLPEEERGGAFSSLPRGVFSPWERLVKAELVPLLKGVTLRLLALPPAARSEENGDTAVY